MIPIVRTRSITVSSSYSGDANGVFMSIWHDNADSAGGSDTAYKLSDTYVCVCVRVCVCVCVCVHMYIYIYIQKYMQNANGKKQWLYCS